MACRVRIEDRRTFGDLLGRVGDLLGRVWREGKLDDIPILGGLLSTLRGILDWINAQIEWLKAKDLLKKAREAVERVSGALLPGMLPGLLPVLPRFGEGGVVMGPTQAIIGEAGPEAVIPRHGRSPRSARKQAQLPHVTINVNVAARVTTEGPGR